VSPRRRAFSHEFTVQSIVGSLDYVPVLFTLRVWLPRISSICLIRLRFGTTRVEELIALTGDYSVARAAYEEAIKRRPGRIVALRQKTRVLADSRGGRHDSTLC
jgi:hypothetical protein